MHQLCPSVFRYYNWTLAAPLILSLQAFQKNLPKVQVIPYATYTNSFSCYIFDKVKLSLLFVCFLTVCSEILTLFLQGYRGGLGEGENAKEIRSLVVLAKKGRQYS